MGKSKKLPRALGALVLGLLLAACAGAAATSDSDRHGFYGGVAGGMSRP
jgi:fructose-specific phosphotransferase system IIC component